MPGSYGKWLPDSVKSEMITPIETIGGLHRKDSWYFPHFATILPSTTVLTVPMLTI
jgi:hypothetical protein